MKMSVAINRLRSTHSISSAPIRGGNLIFIRDVASVGLMTASCFGFLSCSFAEMQAEPQIDKNLLEPLSIVFHERISRHVNDGTLCVGSTMAGDAVEIGHRKLHDAPPGLVSELSKASPNVLSYSRCLKLRPDVRTYTYFLEDYKWQENGDLIVKAAFRDGTYGDGLSYRVHKVDGKWTVVETSLVWIS